MALLREMHPKLPADLALVMTGRAALALERGKHSQGVELTVDLEEKRSKAPLSWPPANMTAADQHDLNRITEDGAEAVALAIAHQCREWRVVRRMQREESADWLLRDPNGNQLVALEVSGVAQGSISARVAEKLAQVAGSLDVDQRWAGVVGFGKPMATLRSAKAGKA